jgi:membrane-bound lytic murein transglycosylase F
MRLIVYLKKFSAFLFVLFLPFLFSCNFEKFRLHPSGEMARDLDEIASDGRLKVVTEFNSVNYFIYRGKPMGFQYEVLQELSNHLGIPFDVKVNNDLNRNFEDLKVGQVDLIASNITITEDRLNNVAFTTPFGQVRQVLVQRTPGKGGSATSASYVSSAIDLGGKTVYVRRHSVHAERLRSLALQIGKTINIVEVPVETEQLIRMVSKKEIDFTVADEDIALVNQTARSGLDVSVIISFPQDYAWAVRTGSKQLKSEIDEWLSVFKKSRKYAILYNKYYSSNQRSGIVESAYYSPETGRISPYDEILKKEGSRIGWDWRLLASIMYQESRFNPSAESHAGAFGVMQLMPSTARRFGVDQNSTTEAHIRAGIRFVHWLDIQLEKQISDSEERSKFVLAAYNVGLGHVQDAIRLTEKYGKSPVIWEDNVEYYLLKKSDPKYFSDPLVKHGYAKGTETYRYVRDIMYRYNHYLNISDETDLAQLLQ